MANDKERPFDAGSQTVPDRADRAPKGGRGAIQTIVIVLAALAVLAAVLWIFVPLA